MLVLRSLSVFGVLHTLRISRGASQRVSRVVTRPADTRLSTGPVPQSCFALISDAIISDATKSMSEPCYAGRRWVLESDGGTPEMRVISDAIKDGAQAPGPALARARRRAKGATACGKNGDAEKREREGRGCVA